MALQKITAERTNRFSALVIGQAGMGKTSLLRTILGQEYDIAQGAWVPPKIEPTEKVLTLSAESGLLCVRELVEQGHVEGYEINSIADFKESLALLQTPEFTKRYNWIFIDSLTEIASRCVEAMKAKYPDGKDSFKMWGEYSDTVTAIIKTLRDMRDYNVIFTCLESVETDDNKRRYIAPSISGTQLKERLTSYFDEVFHLTEWKGDDGQTARVFNTKYPLGLAKDRSGRLAELEKPNLLHIHKKIMGA